MFTSDQNQSNNIAKAYNLFTKKWNDDFEDESINDWSGDIDSNAWHLTDSIENDPNPKAHSSPLALYPGLEEFGKADDYGERNDFDLITPEIDLRRFKENTYAYLNFKFYGASSEQDTLSIEGYKSSEQKWYPIDIEFPNQTVDDSGSPSWNFWISPPRHIGMDIHSYTGELTRFKIHWHSDQIPENKIGFYLDDFFIYGYERPPPEYDVGIESVEIYPTDVPIVAGHDFQIVANITNYGTEAVSGLQYELEIKDFTGRHEEFTPDGKNDIDNLNPGESKTITWTVIPRVGGIYYINISINLDSDENLQNNFLDSESLEVYKYYNSFESADLSWYAEYGWYKINVMSDPDPKQHSWANAWYVNTSNDDFDANNSYCLYSPIIDLDGAQTNNLYVGNQIRIAFTWFGKASETDRLYFEYAFNHTDNWTLLTTPNDPLNYISGDNSDRWYSWDTLGTPSLFGHHVQFRWRFEPDSNSEPGEIGYYIDDFSLWVIQEQFGRPKILSAQVIPTSIMNDSRDSAVITCEVIDSTNDLDEVYVNLEPLAGPGKQLLYDDGTHSDEYADDGKFTLELTVPTIVTKGERIVKISAVDKKGNFDNDYLKILVVENLPPIIKKHYPLNSTIKLNESAVLEFSIDAFDPEGGALQYNWFLNSSLISNWSENYFKFNTSFHGTFSAGNYVLGVLVADNGLPSRTDYFEWEIEVLDALPDFEVQQKDVVLSKNNATVNDLVVIEVLLHNLQPPPENNVSVSFIQQSTNASVPDYVFEVYNISKFPGDANKAITITWRANLTCRYLKIVIDPGNKIPELNEQNNEAVVPINVSAPPPIIEPPADDLSNSPEEKVPYGLYLITTGLIAAVISLFLAIGTEFGNYKLYLMLTPLYYRVTGDKILEHKLRSKIYMHIRANPGDHYRSIMAKLKIKNGTLVHHLARLEQEDLITSERDGYFKRFYPVGMRIPKSDVGMYYPEAMPTYNIGEHQVSDIQLRIIKTIKYRPGLKQKEIALKINESRRVVNYHIKLLEQHDLIKVIKVGRKTQCFMVEKGSGS